MTIEHVHDGDIFMSGCDLIVIPVNCVGVMGRGLALEFRKRYPSRTSAYMQACNAKALRPGVLAHSFINGTRFVFFPTKRHWRDPSRLEDVIMGLDASVAIPALGCGLGGLSWDLVRHEIVTRLEPMEGVTAKLYWPQDKDQKQ